MAAVGAVEVEAIVAAMLLILFKLRKLVVCECVRVLVMGEK